MDYIALTKPRVTLMTILMGAGGVGLAGGLPWLEFVGLLAGVATSVGAANALNMVWEKETDALMVRTSDRPIPAGRISATNATLFGVVMPRAANQRCADSGSSATFFWKSDWAAMMCGCRYA